MTRSTLTLLLLLLGAPEALRADEPAPKAGADPAGEAADAFVAARAKGDGAAMAAVATKEPPPSPWFVAELLLARGKPDDAAAFAQAARRVGTERLAEYVASRREAPAAPETLAALQRAERAHRRGDRAEVLAVLGAIRASLDGVPGAFADYLRAQSLRDDPSSVEALPSAQRAMAEAERIGWIGMAGESAEIVGKGLLRRGKLAEAEHVMRRRVAIEHTLGHVWSEGHALGDLGMPLEAMGRLDEAVEAYRGSLTIMERLGDKREMGRARGNIGDVLYQQARFREALVEKEAAMELERAVGDHLSAAVHRSAAAMVRIAALGDWDVGVPELEAAIAELDRLGATRHAAASRHNLALAYSSRGERARALALLEEVLPALERLQDADGVAAVLVQISRLHREAGDVAGAGPPIERAVAMRREQRAAKGLVVALTELGQLHAARGDNTAALAVFDEAAKVDENAGNLLGAAGVAQERAEVLARAGRYAEARAAIEDVLRAVARRSDPVSRARTLVSVARTQSVAADPDGALDTLRAAGEVFEREHDAAGVAAVIDQTARTLFQAGRLTEALAAATRAAEDLERVGRRRAHVDALDLVAETQLALGDLDGADATLVRALALAENGPPGPRARLLDSQAHAANLRGDLGRALTLMERSLALSREAGTPGRISESLTNLGIVHAGIGDLARALERYEQALAIDRASGEAYDVARTLQNRGNARLELGEIEGAEADFREALGLFEASGWPDPAIDVLTGIAETRSRAGRRDEARVLLEEAMRRHQGAPDGPDVAILEANLAMLLAADGEHAKAAETLAAAAKALRARPYVLVKTQVALAESLHALGRAPEAVKVAHEAVATSQLLARGLAGEEAALGRSKVAWVAERLLPIVLATGDARAVWDLIEPTRAVALLEALRGRALLQGARVSPELLRAEAEAHAREAAARRRLDARLSEGVRKEVGAAHKEYETARLATLEVVRRIQREAKSAAELVFPETADLEAVKARLAPEEALLEYALLETSSAVLVVTRTEARLVLLPARAEVEAAAERAFPQGLPSPDAAPMAALKKLLLDRLALPATVKRLLVSPDGQLAYVPFSALDPSRDVVAVASGSTLLLLAQEAGPPGEGVLGVGNPDYAREPAPAPGTSLLRGGWELAPLPGSEAEVRAVGTKVLLGPDATEAKLRATLAAPHRWRAVHLACHGLVDPDQPLLCSLAVTPGGEDDGLLSAGDVCRLRVRADLVVLSACETGRGKFYASEGIFGLTRAFMFAGAPRVLVSLWKVDDEATKALMVAFYERLGAGVPTPRALREAQEVVRTQERWKAPKYWAAWVLWGLPS